MTFSTITQPTIAQQIRRVSAFLLLMTLFVSRLFAQQAVLGPSLTETLDVAAPLDQLEVIVSFDQEGPLTLAQRLSLQRLGLKGTYFHSLPMAGVVATPAQINALLAMQGVRSVWHNDPLAYENDSATALSGVDALREDAQFQQMNGGVPFSGKGVGVMINDSGVDGTHEDLKYNVVQNVSGHLSLRDFTTLAPYVFVEDIPHTDVGGGHGTHVAGIIGGSGALSGGLYEGVAPGADLIGYGSGVVVALIDVLSGFDYALTHQYEYNIRIVSNSWGNTDDVGTDFNPDDPTNIATKRLADRGVIVVFSAGNSGPTENTITGNFKKAPWVITVAAGTKAGVLADFSSRGRPGHGGTVTVGGQAFTWEDRPTITAPGEHIISARASGAVTVGAIFDPLGEILIPPQYLPFYTSLSGTSMACPHVAGIVALMLEANPQLDVYDIRAILQDTATEMTGLPHEIGAGHVNAYASVAAALSLDPTPYLHEPFGTNARQANNFEWEQASLLDEVRVSNYPNPFNPSTQIQFNLPADGPVRLAVYNLLGQRVRLLVDSANLSAGTHQVTFEASDLASGTYLYRLETPQQTISRRMVLMK